MFTGDHYLPILAGKAGELAAVGHLSAGARIGLTPILDIPPVRRPHPPRPGAENPKPEIPRTPVKEMQKVLDRLVASWGTDRIALIDLDGFERYTLDALHPVDWVSKQAQARGLRLGLCVSTRSSSNALRAARACRDRFADTVVRTYVSPAELVQPSVLRPATDRVVKESGLHARTTDLIIDPERLPIDGLPAGLVAEAVQTLRSFRWRSVALASTCLPNFEDLPSDVERRYIRRDWNLWKELTSARAFELVFADYGVTGPRSDDDDPPFSPAPHLRYSTDREFWIYKGKKNAPEEIPIPGTTYPELCVKLLRARGEAGPVFRGRSFSWGDRQIWTAGETSEIEGNPQNFVEFATNHHLTQVVRQIGHS